MRVDTDDNRTEMFQDDATTQDANPATVGTVKGIEEVDGESPVGNTMGDLLNRVDNADDWNRIKTATALINTFNFAIQVQAGRQSWQPNDYQRFVRALIALDGIGRAHSEDKAVSQVQADIEETVKSFAGRNQRKVQEPLRRDPLSSLPKG